MALDILSVKAPHRQPLAELLGRIETFSPEEVQCALELIDAGIAGSADYQVVVATKDGQVVGYICYGPTPMTEGTFDLYWIASDPQVRGQGVGAALVAAMEGDIRRHNGRVIRVETSAMEAYGPTRGFYSGMKYVEECRFKDFYRQGEDLIILSKRI
ncbi:MAG: GNAT family N-acetyltransferase [Myxococcota bacterium]|nr:GNAT family N-acetyltransferase [Myxococcota bacterium]